jgi:hypothetical protein
VISELDSETGGPLPSVIDCGPQRRQAICLSLLLLREMLSYNQQMPNRPVLNLKSLAKIQTHASCPENPFLLVTHCAMTQRSERTELPEIKGVRRSEPNVSMKPLVKTVNGKSKSKEKLARNFTDESSSDARNRWRDKAPLPIDTTNRKKVPVENQGINRRFDCNLNHECQLSKSNTVPSAQDATSTQGLADMLQQIKCANLLMKRLAMMRRRPSEKGISPHSAGSRKSPLRGSFRNSPKSARSIPPPPPLAQPTPVVLPESPEADTIEADAAPAARRPAPAEAAQVQRYLPGCGRVLLPTRRPARSPLRHKVSAGALPASAADRKSPARRSGPAAGAEASSAAAACGPPVAKVLRPPSAGKGGCAGPRRLRIRPVSDPAALPSAAPLPPA